MNEQRMSPADKRHELGAGFTELGLVFAGAIGLILVIQQWPARAGLWWTTPAVLLAAAVIPGVLRREALFGVIRLGPIRTALVFTACTGIIVFPLAYLAAMLLTRLGLPLQAQQPHDYPSWVAYQLLYVAVSEEVFFRGYLLSKILRSASGHLWIYTAIVTSAACFAVAHAAIQGQASGLLTFLPGLVLGWLYVRTGGLLAPILFHGMANVFWLFVVS